MTQFRGIVDIDVFDIRCSGRVQEHGGTADFNLVQIYMREAVNCN